MIKLENKNLKDIKIKEFIGEDEVCTCSNKHVPNPMKWIEISYGDQRRVVCPAFLVNLIDLLEEYDLRSGPPPGRVTKHYGKSVRDLARTLWTPLDIR